MIYSQRLFQETTGGFEELLTAKSMAELFGLCSDTAFPDQTNNLLQLAVAVGSNRLIAWLNLLRCAATLMILTQF